MNEETYRILKMLEENKISASEAKELIDALSAQGEQTDPKNNKKKRKLKVEIDSHDPNKKDNARIRVNIPLNVAKKLAGLTVLIPEEARSDLREKGIDLDTIDLEGLIDMFINGEIDENLVDIVSGDDESGARIHVMIE